MSKAHSPLRQIRASAGSGKTYTLTGDILGLLAQASGKALSGCVAPGAEAYGWSEILGITFTNRAALEMKERVLDRLKAVALGEKSESGWTAASASLAVDNLLRNAGALNIRTIDSLIHLIVRLSALDLDLPPDFEPNFNDEDIFAPLLDEMAEKARDGDEVLARDFALTCSQMIHYGGHSNFLAGGKVRANIFRLASFLLLHPELEDGPGLSSPAEIEAHLQKLRENMRDSSKTLHHLLLEGKVDANGRFLQALVKCFNDELPPEAFSNCSTYFSKESLDECLNKKGKGCAGAEAEALFPQVCEYARLYSEHGNILRSALQYYPFLRLARRLLKELSSWQHKSASVPASRVPALAGLVLSGAYGVNESFCRMGNRLTHILVDEFQDTSREQWQALKFLVVEALSRGGSLTVVGDVKQAIYSWRGGDADLFDEVPDDPDLRAIVPRPERKGLEYNWRSRANVIAWNNLFFSRLADRDLAGELMNLLMGKTAKASLVDESAARLAETFLHCEQSAEKAAPGGLVRLSLIPEESAGEELARRLPQRVLELGQRHPWNAITILTRSNKESEKVVRWLLAAGIPVVSQGSLLLAEQPIIAQSVALLEFLDYPENNLAFWAVLSGQGLLPPLPGLQREELERWAAGRLNAAGKESRLSLANAFRARWPELWQEYFTPLLDEAGLLTPYDTMHEIFQHWRVWERNPEAAGFLSRFLEVLYLAEQRGCNDLSSFVRYWQDKGQEEKAPLPESMNSVKIMTIHKAKGLESEVVLVPWHDFYISANDEWVPWNYENIRAVLPLSTVLGDPYLRDKGKVSREALHLLYVAWTRAVSELHCFIQTPGSNAMNKALSTALAPLLGVEKGLRQSSPGEWQWGEETQSGEAFVPSQDGKLCPDAGGAGFGPATGEGGQASAGFVGSADLGELGESVDLGAITQNSEEDWRPMHWLPRLQIYRNRVESGWRESTGAARRGTLLHHCLEYMLIDAAAGDPQQDAQRAVRRGLAGLRLPDRQELERDFAAALAWYAALPQAAHWLKYGIPEHALLGEKGENLRVDLLVDAPAALGGLLAVEYKSGGQGELPKPEHVRQLKNYLDLLSRAEARPARGVLVYLDRRELFELDASTSGKEGGAI